GGEGHRQHGSYELDAALNQTFIGMTTDQLLVEYGPPSRTARLDDGTKMIQYNSKRTWITEAGNHHYTNCELRLWLQDKKVHRVDYLGDQWVCAKFATTARKQIIDDERTPK
ncbi:MAG: hypothetical protein K2Q32_02440, partial [Alphaproteobacteria bacterium]|nr:hypothetical protein [Alphaproteobacteria bacterium]